MVKKKTIKGPEQKKYEKWFRAEKKKGLVDVKFFFGDLTGATVESLFGELNRIQEAVDMSDREVLGKYSPL